MNGYFDFEWCGRLDANDADQEKGIDAAYAYCEARGINPAEIWARAVLEEDPAAQDVWLDIESAAIAAMCDGWCEQTENASLSWIVWEGGAA